MPIIKHTPLDLLISRATATLNQIARFDVGDLSGEFDDEKVQHVCELWKIRKDLEALGKDWSEFYGMSASEVEIYDTEMTIS